MDLTFWLTLAKLSLHSLTTRDTWLGRYVRARNAASGSLFVLMRSSKHWSSLENGYYKKGVTVWDHFCMYSLLHCCVFKSTQKKKQTYFKNSDLLWWTCIVVSHIQYLLPLKKIRHEGHIVLAVPFCPFGQLAHHGGVARSRGEKEQAAVILSVVQALLGQAELALTDSQLSKLLPLLLRLFKKKKVKDTTINNGVDDIN